MKKFNIYALVFAGAVTLTSCEDMFGSFLDKQPSSDLTKEDVLSDYTTLIYNHNDTYNFLLHGAQRINGSWLDAATDLAECAIGTSGTRTAFNVGNYYGSGASAELVSIWESRYRAIRKCNTTIETLEADTDNKLRPSETALDSYVADKKKNIAEARFLRAYFYWEMFLRYGPVPLVTTTLDPNGDLLTDYSERPSTKSFLDYLVSEAKGCEADLLDYQGTGEVDKPTARAFYVRLMLYMASPRYASTTGVTWAQVVDAAEGFIRDFGGNFALYTESTSTLR